ncbi:MAG TPA: hypothetical protein VH988_23265 [Thermoanaerobaculia bacterium]|jgi:hypothetical protein|nr:hypothetical protein [Thermoanaerobaculia bacterium]
MRFMSRVLTVSAVVLSLAVLSVPVANARPQDDRTPAVHHEASWLQTAMSWIANLLGGDHHEALAQSTSTGTGTGTLTGGVTPMTGSCIDPNGGPRCGGI